MRAFSRGIQERIEEIKIENLNEQQRETATEKKNIN